MSYQYDMSPTANPGIGFEPDRLQAIDFQRNDANRAALREYLKLGALSTDILEILAYPDIRMA